VLGSSALEVYLNHRLIREKNIELREAEEVAAAALRGVAHISRVYTASQIRAGQMQRDPVSQAISYGYYDGRSGDLLIVPENYWMLAEDDPIYVTTHGTPFEYDNHVPLIFLGPGIAPGKYHRQVKINDVQTDPFGLEAPTAFDTSDELPITVDFRKRPLAGLPMQVIDVLGNEKTQHAYRFEFGERGMSGIRARDFQRSP